MNLRIRRGHAEFSPVPAHNPLFVRSDANITERLGGTQQNKTRLFIFVEV